MVDKEPETFGGKETVESRNRAVATYAFDFGAFDFGDILRCLPVVVC